MKKPIILAKYGGEVVNNYNAIYGTISFFLGGGGIF